MTYEEIKYLFDNLPQNYKTKDIDRLNKKLIKEKQDISLQIQKHLGHVGLVSPDQSVIYV